MLLVCEVLPLLLHMPADLPSKQLYRFLHKSIEFYLVYLMSKPSAVEVISFENFEVIRPASYKRS